MQAPFSMPSIKAPVFSSRDFVIADFGAVPGAETDSAEAIPAGEWLTGAVHFKSNVNLRLAKDAVQGDDAIAIKSGANHDGWRLNTPTENVVTENIEATSTKFSVPGIETDVLYQWRALVPSYEERLTPIRGITVRNVKVNRTSAPFRILGDKDQPVREVLLENVAIDTVYGQKSRYENVANVRETNVSINTFLEEPDKEDENK